MIENVQRATSGILHQTGANFGATQKRGQAGMVIDIGLADFGPAAHWDNALI